jgi:hypothetical protein
MSMALGIVFVHYHTPALLEAAVGALRSDLGPARSAACDWIVVDNGSDAAGRAALARLPVEVVSGQGNVGYAAGANIGAARTNADALLLVNPDVLVRPGCVEALLDQLGDDVAAVGPRFCWDDSERFLLPPLEPDSRTYLMQRALAGLPGGAGALRRAWRRHAWKHWDAEAPLVSWSLSGGLLLIARRAWARVGAFDRGFRLYFEEREWLLRARRRGLECRFVPTARAVHYYAQSAIQEPRVAAWYAQSCARFEGMAYDRGSRAIAGALRRVSGSPGSRPARVLDSAPSQPPRLRPQELPATARWLEISTDPLGVPAAAERLRGSPDEAAWEIAPDVWARLAPGWYSLRAVDPHGNDLGAWSFEKVAGLPGAGQSS